MSIYKGTAKAFGAQLFNFDELKEANKVSALLDGEKIEIEDSEVIENFEDGKFTTGILTTDGEILRSDSQNIARRFSMYYKSKGRNFKGVLYALKGEGRNERIYTDLVDEYTFIDQKDSKPEEVYEKELQKLEKEVSKSKKDVKELAIK